MTPESVNAEIDKSLDKPAHKLLVKVLIIYSIVLGAVIYVGWKAYDNQVQEQKSDLREQRDQWKKIALGCNSDLKQSYIDRIEENQEARTEYDTITQLIKKKRK